MTAKDLRVTDNILGINDVTEGNSIWRALVAEFLGTLLLVAIGCGSVVTLGPPALGLEHGHVIQIALTFGLVIGTLVQCIGHISGCHVNPAVTISLFVTGEIKLLRALFYILVQCLGAAAGSGLLLAVTPKHYRGNLGLTDLGVDVEPYQGVIVEAFLTFLLLLVIHAVCDPDHPESKSVTPLAIGFCILTCHVSGVQYTGSSLNPARSFGPAVVNNLWTNHWVYWIGPIIGGVLAGLVYKFVFKVKKGGEDPASYDF